MTTKPFLSKKIDDLACFSWKWLGLVFVFFLFIHGISWGLKKKGLPHSKKKAKTYSVRRQHPFKILPSPLQGVEAEEFRIFTNKLLALKSGEKEQIRALIIGDSHMQCEDFGSALRQFFVDSLSLPIAGKGFVFPYPLAKTSHRSDNRFGPNQFWHGCRFTKEGNSCDWGLAGWTAHFPGDSVRFSWTNGGQIFNKGDTLLIFSPIKCSNSYQVWISIENDSVVSMNYDARKRGFYAIIPRKSQSLNFHLKKQGVDSSEFVLQGLLHAPCTPGMVLGISGTNGARFDHYLQNPDFARHLRIVNPDLLIISLGTNEAFSPGFQEAEVKQYLNTLLVRIKAAAPHAAILLLGPPDHRMTRKSNPRISTISQIYAQVAEELDLVFWDQQKAMGGPGAIFAWYQKGLATKDMVHFTPRGYQLQARLLGTAIKKNVQP